MPTDPLRIDPDIRVAETLPGWAYADEELFRRSRDAIFARSWLYAGDADAVKAPGSVSPLRLRAAGLDEPLLLARDKDDTLRLLSNVCTHRANLLVQGDGRCNQLRCGYHGRRFALDGKLLGSPEFEATQNFPRPQDDLPQVPLGQWQSLLFGALEPEASFAEWTQGLDERLAHLPWREARYDPESSHDYVVAASWALYVENYLEGFHIPYVHPGLAAALDYSRYREELLPWGTLQIGVASTGEPSFDLPAGHPDHGTAIAGYYAWLFPTTMINVYPWGLSLNVVIPEAPRRTRVRFLSFVWNPDARSAGAGADLDRVEREDEAVVEQVQRGVDARLYQRGRYSASRELGVHHFHRLLSRAWLA